MTAPEQEDTGTVLDEDVLIVRGRILSRTHQPRFREVVLHFAETNYDTQAQITRLPESITCPMDSTGRFDVKLYPSTNGAGFIIKGVFTAFDGKIYTDYRTMPSTGIVDYFECPKATAKENTRWPNGETPILVSDYNKPGGPLQLTDRGTIDDKHIPGDFLRVDDPRVEHLELSNYLTKIDYEADQLVRNSLSVPFTNQTIWEYTHNLGYRPLVECVDQGGDVVMGGVSYPDSTTVRVEWDAPTSGTMIVR